MRHCVRESLRGRGNLSFDNYMEGLWEVLHRVGIMGVEKRAAHQGYAGTSFNFDAARIGTLAPLDLAAAHELVDLQTMFERLRATTFRSPLRLMVTMLEQDAERRKRRKERQ